MTASVHNTYAEAPSGMQFISVQRVQCALNARGSHLPVDGKWGQSTADALNAFMGNNFDYDYITPFDGDATVKVTPALNQAMVCPAERAVAQTTEVPAATSTTGWWVAGALAAVGVGLLIWAVPRHG